MARALGCTHAAAAPRALRGRGPEGRVFSLSWNRPAGTVKSVGGGSPRVIV